MPIYKEAPISPILLEENIDKLVLRMVEINAKKHYLIAPKGEIKGGIPSEITLVELEGEARFTYGNNSTILKVLEGEKAIPLYRNNQKMEESICILSIEELLELSEKNVYITGSAKTPGAYKFPKNITPRTILNACGVKTKVKGIFFGHPMGVILDESKLDETIELTTDYIEVIDESDCVLDRLLSIANQFERESCGRCVFGYEGVTQIRMILSDIAQKKGKTTDITLLMELCLEMKNQALCEIGVSIANTVTTAIDLFQEEIEEHITKKSCKASVCTKFLTFHILPDLCTGCNECVDVCEEDAIEGKKRFIHVIDQDECIQCGACQEACEEEAIVKAGALKPRCPKKPIPCKR